MHLPAGATAGGSSLSYDADEDQYVYGWKTYSGWSDTCRQFVRHCCIEANRPHGGQSVRSKQTDSRAASAPFLALGAEDPGPSDISERAARLNATVPRHGGQGETLTADGERILPTMV